ncbi:MAG TPA: hypothetical protein VMS77_04740 [Conexivisphaerales archaeon]|nr:hypothetical protein [Conexivisphaerales archaeon]
MKFSKLVWAASASVGVAMTLLLSYLPTPMLIPVAGVQQRGAPAPVLAAPVYPGATMTLVPSGVVVDLLFWSILAAMVLAPLAGRKR